MAEKLFITRDSLYVFLSRLHKKMGVRNSREMLNMLNKSQRSAMSSLRFTRRGKDVFLFVKEGLTDKHIGEHMGISVSAVKKHKEIMLLQNECSTMLELIAKYHGTTGESPEVMDIQQN
jgi:DNA-binding CsgD family transcriptional regulator